VNTVNVRWDDGYLETFVATEARFGCDLLWLKLSDGAIAISRCARFVGSLCPKKAMR
jgi:hypothetical protein